MKKDVDENGNFQTDVSKKRKKISYFEAKSKISDCFDKIDNIFSKEIVDFLETKNDKEVFKKQGMDNYQNNQNNIIINKKGNEKELIEMLRLNINMLVNKLNYEGRNEMLKEMSGWLRDHNANVPDNPLPILQDLTFGSSSLDDFGEKKEIEEEFQSREASRNALLSKGRAFNHFLGESLSHLSLVESSSFSQNSSVTLPVVKRDLQKHFELHSTGSSSKVDLEELLKNESIFIKSRFY
jgi:hypothetical protein